MSAARIYLDHNASSPLRPGVLAAMLPFLESRFGNASSPHWFGQRARAAVEEARAQVAALIGAAPAEIVFTGSGSEADNLALRGVLLRAKPARRGLVTSALEHHAVLHCARALAEEGYPVAVASANAAGAVDLEDLAGKVGPTTLLLSLMLANNETGCLQPVAAAMALGRRHGALLHCDAVQAAGRIAIDVQALGVDLLALSAHKIGGPQGVGALYVRRGTPLAPLVRGGAQERGRRAGTENVAGVVGFGAAAELAQLRLSEEAARQARLRDELERRLCRLDGVRRNGEEPRLANTTNLSFEGVEAEDLMMALDLDGVAVSTGAACAAGAVEPSHVLRAMALPPERAQSSLRFSLGPQTTEEEIHLAAEVCHRAVERMRRGGARPGTATPGWA